MTSTTAQPLTVNRQSWHYKLVMWHNYNSEPKDLCSYFWSGVSTAFMGVIVYVMGTLLAYAAAAAFLSPFVTYGVQAYLGIPLVQTFFSYAIGHSAIPGAIVFWFHFIPSFFVYLVAAAVGYSMFRDTDLGTKWREGREATAHLGLRGLIREMHKAFKGRYCPLLEMEGDRH